MKTKLILSIAVTMAGAMTATGHDKFDVRTDSLYAVSQKEQTIKSYLEVLESMSSQRKIDPPYAECLAKAAALMSKDNERFNGHLLRYSALYDLYSGNPERFKKKILKAKRIFHNQGNKIREGKVCSDLGTFYLYRDQDSAMFYLEEGMKVLADTICVDKASILNTISIIKYYRGDYDNSLADMKRVMTMLEECGETDPLPTMAGNIASVYNNNKEMYDSATNYYRKALSYCETTGNHFPEGNLMANLAVMYCQIDQYNEALAYANKAVELTKKYPQDSEGAINALHARAGANKALGKLREAKSDFRTAIEMGRKENSHQLMLKSIPGLLSIYGQEGNRDSIIYYTELGTKAMENIGKPIFEVANFMETRAEVNTRIGNHKEALEDLLWVRRQGTTTMPQKELLYKISKEYAACGDYVKAFTYQDSAYVASDSLFNKNMADALAHWNAEFENQEHLLKIETMKADHLQLIIWLLVIGAAVVSLVVAIVAQRRRLKRNAETQPANKYVEGLESERGRLSKELHDGVCNDLLGVQMLAQLAKSPEEQQEMIEQLQRTREDVRRISHDLASPVMDQTSFRDMVERYVERFHKASDKEINLNIDIEEEPEPEKSTHLYRIVQELTANAVKHSSGKKITISISSKSKGVHIRIDSDGTPDMNSRNHGLGMVSIRNRVTALGGTIINSSDAEGYHTQIDII